MPFDWPEIRAAALDYAVRTVWALLVALITILLARLVRSLSIRALARHRAHGNAAVLLGNLSQLGVFAIGALLILAIYTQGAFGWILTSLGVFWIVVGLSFQDILKNFFAGVWILVERPFRIGDHIQVGFIEGGEIREISFRTTQLQTADGREVIVPNANLMTDPVIKGRARLEGDT